MISEEKVISRMRKRGTRMLVYGFLLVGILAYSIFIGVSTLGVTRETVHEEVAIRMRPPGESSGNITTVTSNSRTLGRMNQELMLMCILMGILLGALIAEATGASKDRLIVSLWDRVRELEKRVQPEVGHVSSDGAPSDEPST